MERRVLSKGLVRFSCALVSAILGFSLHSYTAGAEDADSRFPHTVSGIGRYIVDGDSLYLTGFKTQVRLWGVDAPEYDEPGYQAAKNELRRMALNQKLSCRRVDIDKYQRMVARCFVLAADGAEAYEINRRLIAGGVVAEYCWFSKGFYNECDE